MTTFTVWKFDDPQGAERAVGMLEDAQANGLVKIDDHAIVSWPAGASQPNTKHGHAEAPNRSHGARTCFGRALRRAVLANSAT